MRSKSICGNVAGLEAIAADLDDVVVVFKVVLRHLDHGLGLKRLDKRAAQGELQSALQIFVLRFGDVRAFLRALASAVRACGRARAGN